MERGYPFCTDCKKKLNTRCTDKSRCANYLWSLIKKLWE